MATDFERQVQKALMKMLPTINKTTKSIAIETSQEYKKKMYDRALFYINQYYDDYEPSLYNRTYSLKDSILAYQTDYQVGKGWCIEVGVGYYWPYLYGVYRGSSQYDPTDPWWVVENFLLDIHPRTDKKGNYKPTRSYAPHVVKPHFKADAKKMQQKFVEDIKIKMTQEILDKLK